MIKVLHADVAARTRGAGRVVRPDRGCNAPAFAIPLGLELVVDVEASQEDDLAARFTERGDARLSEPLLRIRVVVFEDAAELLVCAIARAFALEADDERLGGVGVEEFANVFVEVAEVFGAGE